MDDKSLPEFIYQTLDPEKEEIRLLKLLSPGLLLANEPVRCCLDIDTLDSGTKYTALSYAWESSTRNVPLILDDSLFWITKSLDNALRQFSDANYLSDLGYLWVDSICINQHNDTEKTLQVQKMRDIYGNAEKVVVWLGPASTCSHSAISMLEELGKQAWEKTIYVPTDVDDSLFGDHEQLEANFDAIDRLLSRPWWTRSWIVQEITLARAVLFICGTEALHGTILFWALCAMRMLDKFCPIKSLDTEKAVSDSKWALSITSFEKAFALLRTWFYAGVAKTPFHAELGETIDLKSLLLDGVCYNRQATDPRDHVFAFLGIASDALELGIFADYSKSCATVYTEVAAAFLKKGDLGLFGLCGSSTGKTKLPSWAPDFAYFSQDLSELSSTNARLQNDRVYSAAASLSPSIHFTTGPDLRLLHIDGIHFDDVQFVGLFNGLLDSPDLDISMHLYGLVQILSEITELASASRSHDIYGVSILEAMWCTLISDIDIQETSPRSEQDEVINTSRTTQSSRAAYKTFAQDLTAVLKNPNLIRCRDFFRFKKQSAAVCGSTARKRLFTTAKGYIGLGPGGLRPGDSVVVFLGAQQPSILRMHRPDRFQLIGVAYVHEIMDGQILNLGLKQSTFTLL